jgi:hypothetical protein
MIISSSSNLKNSVIPEKSHFSAKRENAILSGTPFVFLRKGECQWKTDIGSILSPTNRTVRFISVLRQICRAECMNTAKAFMRDSLKHMALKCWFGMKNILKLMPLSHAKRNLKNGNVTGKLISSRDSIFNGAICTVISTNNVVSFRQKTKNGVPYKSGKRLDAFAAFSGMTPLLGIRHAPG